MIVSGSHIWSHGPFSAVRPAEVPQDPVESAPPEPVDEMIPMPTTPGQERTPGGSRSSSEMARQGRHSAGAALAAFPQVVHLLANPELHLGEQLANETGLPIVSLDETSVEELAGLLDDQAYAQGFILEGFPSDTKSAQNLDALLGATSPNERRVLGWESADLQQQEIVNHYIDQGLLWSVPSESAEAAPELVKNAMLDCLVGLPVRKLSAEGMLSLDL